MADLTHFDASGRPRMVDVSAKPETDRCAAARGLVRMDDATLALVLPGRAANPDERQDSSRQVSLASANAPIRRLPHAPTAAVGELAGVLIIAGL